MNYILLSITDVISGGVDLDAMVFFFLTVCVPVLTVAFVLCYLLSMRSRRRRENDQLILALTDKGQTLTPELVESIREEDNKKKNAPTMENAYRKIFVGVGFILSGVILCVVVNMSFAAFFWIFGICTMCQGAAIWLALRHQAEKAKDESIDQREQQ